MEYEFLEIKGVRIYYHGQAHNSEVQYVIAPQHVCRGEREITFLNMSAEGRERDITSVLEYSLRL
jgi:hypothetical protein